MYAPIKITSIFAACLLGACATVPTGPSVMVLPGSTKNFDQFRFDDADCKYFANNQIGGKAAVDSANNEAIKSAVVGTVIGAAAGAAMDGRHGAGFGAGSGLVIGSMVGSGSSQHSDYDLQRRYDGAYVQCMYAKGHSVPVAGRHLSSPSANIPPPPPGNPPPPPPGAPAPR